MDQDTLWVLLTMVWSHYFAVSLADAPDSRRRALKTNKKGTVIIEFIGQDKYSVAEKSKLVILGDNEQDHIWGESNVNFLHALRMI